MGCAGCLDCDPSAFHLHLTVWPQKLGAVYDNDCFVLDMKPLIIRNLIGRGFDWYDEWIPTMTFKGTYEDALFTLGEKYAQLKARGYEVRRVKIEGPPQLMPFARYYEAHIKLPNTPESLQLARDHHIPVSIAKVDEIILTIRNDIQHNVRVKAQVMGFNYDLKVEAALYDTNSSLDEKWMNAA